LVLLREKDIPPFDNDLDWESLRVAINRSIEYFRRLPEDRLFQYGEDQYSVGHLIRSMETFLYILDQAEDMEELTDLVRQRFNVYQSVGSDGRGTVLYTGYYEPILRGALTPDETYRWPLYKRPNDLVEIDLELFSGKFKGEKITARYDGSRIVPYFTREEIDSNGMLFGRQLEIAWLEDLIDVFFLQIQGSGQILLEDGTTLRVNYSAWNGRPYRSIGGLLIDRGIIEREEMNIPRLREYLRDNSAQREEILNHNESYVFFRVVEEGPLGNIEVPLTPGRSIATDSRLFPKGVGLYQCRKASHRRFRLHRSVGALFAVRPQPGYRRCNQGAGAGRPFLGKRRGGGDPSGTYEKRREALFPCGEIISWFPSHQTFLF